jgi:hypothetical protein
MFMSINAQIIDQQVRKIVEDHVGRFPTEIRNSGDEHKKRSAAFVLLCIQRLLDIPLDDAIPCLTEGGQDHGIDGMYVGEVQNGAFPVFLFQGKYSQNMEGKSGFPQSGIIKLTDAIRVLFDPDIPLNVNRSLKIRIEEARSLVRDGELPHVIACACNNGGKWEANGQDSIDESAFGDRVTWEHVNHDRLVAIQKDTEPVSERIHFSGTTVVDEAFNFRRVLLGKVPVAEIKRLFDQHGDRLLQRNIRRFLGTTGNRVNEGIRESLREEGLRSNFYFYNNGITITCSKFRRSNFQQQNHTVQVESMAVINGGQTCRTIQQTLGDPDLREEDFENVHVLVRLYELSGADDELVQKITFATNSQNPVDLRDLRSNDERQQTLAIAVEQLGYSYKRHRDDATLSVSTITTSVAAEAVLAVWRHRPHQAKFRRSEHFDGLYDTIFEPQLNAAQLVTAVLVFRAVEKRRRSADPDTTPSYLPYASHFLAMLMGKELLDSCTLPLEHVNHTTFELVRRSLNDREEDIYTAARNKLDGVLRDEFGHDPGQESLQKLSATFRRGDLFEKLNALPGAAYHMV